MFAKLIRVSVPNWNVAMKHFRFKDWSRYMTVPSSGKSLNFDATVSYKLSLGCENALEQILSQVWHLLHSLDGGVTEALFVLSRLSE